MFRQVLLNDNFPHANDTNNRERDKRNRGHCQRRAMLAHPSR